MLAIINKIDMATPEILGEIKKTLRDDYILVSEKDRGFEPGSAFTSDLSRINAYIFGHPETFQAIDSFALPNGDAIRLYKVLPA